MTRRSLQVNISVAPTLQPTEEEFKNFKEYMTRIQKQYSQNYGIVKVQLFMHSDANIIPPESWNPRNSPYTDDLKNLVIKSPIQQNAQGSGGIYEMKHISAQPITYENYVKSNAQKDKLTENKSLQEIQEFFWKSVAYSPPLYGADLSATLMDQSAGSWNLNNLQTLLKQVFQYRLKGVTSSYCYIGSWKSMFCWHIQDLNLAAINYLHFGRSKIWYGISPNDAHILEEKARKKFYISYSKCPQYIRHKTILINPYLLKREHPQIKICKVEQKQRQFVVAFSKGYHCGFNTGINVAEAVNFATYKWILRIKDLQSCYCRKSSIKGTYKNLIQIIQQNSAIKNDPQYLIAKQSNLSQTQNHPEESEENKKNLTKTKLIQKLPKKKIQKKLAICSSCKTDRFMYAKDIDKAPRENFTCQMLGKKCKKKKQNLDEEYRP